VGHHDRRAEGWTVVLRRLSALSCEGPVVRRADRGGFVLFTVGAGVGLYWGRPIRLTICRPSHCGRVRCLGGRGGNPC